MMKLINSESSAGTFCLIELFKMNKTPAIKKSIAAKKLPVSMAII